MSRSVLRKGQRKWALESHKMMTRTSKGPGMWRRKELLQGFVSESSLRSLLLLTHRLCLSAKGQASQDPFLKWLRLRTTCSSTQRRVSDFLLSPPDPRRVAGLHSALSVSWQTYLSAIVCEHDAENISHRRKGLPSGRRERAMEGMIKIRYI